MGARITVEVSEYSNEVLKKTVDEINEVSPLKVTKKQVTDLILFFGCSFIHEKIIPVLRMALNQNSQIKLVWPLLGELGKDPDKLFDTIGELIVRGDTKVDKESVEKGIKVLKQLYKDLAT